MGLVLPCSNRELTKVSGEMKGCWAKYVLGGIIIALLAGCESRPTDRGQQYKDGKLTHPFELVNNPNAKNKPVNGQDFAQQVSERY